MGNTASASAKPALPSLNLSKVKLLSADNPDDLYISNCHPQRTVVSLSSARLPGVARKLPPAPQQQQIAVTTQLPQDGQGMDHKPGQATNRIIANNIVTKPQMPALNMGRLDFSGQASGSDQGLTARGAAHGPGSLPQVQQRGSSTSRPTHAQAAAAVQQYAGSSDAIRTAPAPAVETGPITPAQALKRYGDYLTPFELSEVLQYHHIWFLGKADVQKIRGNPHLQKTNYGYDDDRGDYTVTPRDHIAYRYEVLSVLGRGSFGQVIKVLDYKTGTYKALKIIRNKKRFHHQAQVELKVLEHLRVHDTDDTNHVIHIQEHFMFRNHLCITFELLSINLYEFIKQNNFAGLSLQLVKRFAAQMLATLRFLRQHKLIHCDLKPENILLVQPQRSAIKVIDFGSSCFVNERLYTYVQSRFYRSPEVILGLPYGCEIDMWSFGCILAELFMGYPLFPGEDETEQLLCVMEIMGPPPRHVVEAASRRKTFFDSNNAPVVVPNSRGKVRHPGTKSLWTVLRCADNGFVDLLERCLRWDPADRLTPEQALAHPWMQEQALLQQQQQPGASSYRQPAGSSRSRQDQAATAPVAAAAAGKLQPSGSLLAGGAGSRTAANMAGGTGKAAASTAGGKLLSAAVLAAAASGASLCSGDYDDVMTPVAQQQQQGGGISGSAGSFIKACATVAAGGGLAAWQAGGGGSAGAAQGGQQGGTPRTPRTTLGTNDTIQSGTDCTPRSSQGQHGGGGGVVSAALAAAAAALADGPLVAALPGGLGKAAGRSAGCTPRHESGLGGEQQQQALGGADLAAATGRLTKQQALGALAAIVSPPQQPDGGGNGSGDGVLRHITRGHSDQAPVWQAAASNVVQMAAAAFQLPCDGSGNPPAWASAQQLMARLQQQQQQQPQFRAGDGKGMPAHQQELQQQELQQQDPFGATGLLNRLLPNLHQR